MTTEEAQTPPSAAGRSLLGRLFGGERGIQAAVASFALTAFALAAVLGIGSADVRES